MADALAGLTVDQLAERVWAIAKAIPRTRGRKRFEAVANLCTIANRMRDYAVLGIPEPKTDESRVQS